MVQSRYFASLWCCCCLANTLSGLMCQCWAWSSALALLTDPTSKPVASCTHIGHPYRHSPDRSGGMLNNTLKGILPLSVCVAIWFFNQVACLNPSPQSILGRPLVCVKAQMHSATLFNYGVLWVVNLHAVLAAARCWSNWLLRYSPPWSEHRALMPLQCCCVQAQALKDL